jgi:hypothetical protein
MEMEKEAMGEGEKEKDSQTQTQTQSQFDEKNVSKYDHGTLVLTQCPVSLPLTHYLSSTGITNSELGKLQERWGENQVSVRLPSFIQVFIVLIRHMLYYIIIH